MRDEYRDNSRFWTEGQPLKEQDYLLLKPILEKAAEYGHTPTKSEVPSAIHIKSRFRVWKDAIKAAGLPMLNDKEQVQLRENGIIKTEILQKTVEISEFIENCVDIPKYLEYCSKCENYNRIWSCPNFSFSQMSVWTAYKSLLLYGRKIYTPAIWIGKTFSKEELRQKYYQLLKPQKEWLLSQLIEMEYDLPGSMALSAGNCNLCGVNSCARQMGEQCRKPERMRYSIEALGGGVSTALRRYFDLKLLWTEAGQLPPYFILLGGLLKGKTI